MEAQEMLPAKAPSMGIGQNGIQVRSISDLMTLASAMFKGGMCPTNVKSVEQAFAIMACGVEVGLSPIQSLNDICFINGRPSVFGNGITALLLASGQLEELPNPVYEGEGESYRCTVTLRRRGYPNPIVRSITVAEARKAGLLSKTGPWQSYQFRMLWWKPLNYAARDGFGDILKGIFMREEAMEIARSENLQQVQVVPQNGVVRKTLDLKAEMERLPAPVQETVPVAQPDAFETFMASEPIPIAEAPPEPVQAPKNGSQKDLRQEIRRMVLDLAGQQVDVAKSMLKEYSSFVGDDGLPVEGFSSMLERRALDASDRWIRSTYGRVKEDWIEKFGDSTVKT